MEVQVIGNVEAYSHHLGESPGRRPADQRLISTKATTSRRATCSSRSTRGRLQAALNQAIANLARDEAALGQAQANLARDTAQAKYAEAQATRYAQLFQSKVISRDQTEQLRAPRPMPPSRRWWRTRRPSRAPRRPSAPARRRWTTPAATRLHQHPVAHRRPHRQPHREAGQRGDGQQHGVVHHQPGRADLRYVRGAGSAAAGHQALHGRWANCRCARGRRTTPRAQQEIGYPDLRRQQRWMSPPAPSS